MDRLIRTSQYLLRTLTHAFTSSALSCLGKGRANCHSVLDKKISNNFTKENIDWIPSQAENDNHKLPLKVASSWIKRICMATVLFVVHKASQLNLIIYIHIRVARARFNFSYKPINSILVAKISSKKSYVAKAALAVLVILTIATLGVLPYTRTQHANAAVNDKINFQARILQANGAVVADGAYNVQFNLYSVSSGGSSLWTETYLNSNSQGIVTKNGYITTSLGSLTSFPNNIPWDQDLWIGMTIRGTGSCAFGSCTPADTEMTPRMKVTAVPYAFRAAEAAQLKTVNGANVASLSINTTTSNQTFQIQDQGLAGTYNLCVQNSASCGFAPSSGGGNYIQNGTALQTANFSVQSAATTSVTATIQGANSQSANILELKAAGVSSPLFSVGATGAITAQNSADSANALSVKNAAGDKVFTVSTSDINANLISNSSFENGVTGWSAKNGAGAPAQSSAQKLYDSNSMSFTTTAANQGAIFDVSLSPSTTYTFLAYVRSNVANAAVFTLGRQDVAGTDVNCTGTGLNQNINNSGWNKVICNFTTGGTITPPSRIYMIQTDAVARTIYVDGVYLLAGTQTGTQYTEGALNIKGLITTPLAVRTIENTYEALSVTNAAGAKVFNFETVNNGLSITGTSSSSGHAATTATGIGFSATSITTGTGISIGTTTTTTGTGLLFNTTANTATTAKAINITGAAAAITADYSGQYINVSPTRTLTAAATRTDSGQFLNLVRSNTVNNAGATYNVSGTLANLQSNCTQTLGSCVDSGILLNVNQQYANATGALINVAGAGTGNLAVLDATNASANGVSIDVQSSANTKYALSVTSNNGATNGLYVRADGNVGIGTSAPGYLLDVNGSFGLAGAASFNGNVTIGDATTDRLTVTSQILGQDALVFQGATDNGFTTTLAVTDPTGSSKTITLPNETGTVCTTGSVCTGYAASAANGYVQFAPASAQADATNNSSIFINKTSTGNLLQLQQGAADKFVVDNGGNIQVAGTTVITSGRLLQAASGSASNPSISLDSDNNTGIYLGGTDDISFTQSGDETVRFVNIGGGPKFSGQIEIDQYSSGTTADNLPGYSFLGDSDMGLFRYGADQLGFSTAATTRLLVDSNGNVGVGTLSPASKLSVNDLATADSLAQVAISTGATTNKGLVVQGVASQSANIFEIQGSNGAPILYTQPNGVTVGNYLVSSGYLATNSGVVKSSTVNGTSRTLQLYGGDGAGDWAPVAGYNAGTRTRVNFNPASGTANLVGTDVTPIINTTGTYSGNVTALRVSPYLQSTTGVASNMLLDLGINRTP